MVSTFVGRCCILLLWSLAILVVDGREVISFDYGWKHRTGLTDWAKPYDLPPKNTDPGIHPKEAAPEYNDSDWLDVQLPHDGLIVNAPSRHACPDGCSGRSYIPRHVLWYRNTFSIPNDWLDEHQSSSETGTGNVISLEFEGSFRNTTVWLNGKLVLNHVCGYTPFRIELEPDLLRSADDKQTIAVFVDPDNGDDGGPARGSGWWYEGGGLYRHVRMVKTNAVHVEPNGLFVKSSFPSAFVEGRTSTVSLHMEASLISKESGICYMFEVESPNQQKVISTNVKELATDLSSSTATVYESIEIQDPMMWTSAEPHLYQVDVVLFECQGERELDRVSVKHGIRKIHFDPNHGFFLNDQKFKIRGFCDHDTFAVVGMALPDRINLFRAQASRSIGGNGRRTSHNPPDPTILDIYDRLGMVVMDENRLFDDNPDYVKNMGDLVRRDRNHPSVVVWSFCNEVGCEGKHEKGGPAFQDITTKFDGTRPTLANMFTFNDLLSNTVDIQGFSHQQRDKLDDCHAALPNKPIFMSECCSCNTMRGEDDGCETQHDNPHSECDQKAFNARCLERLVNASDGVDYSAGTMVWTLFDYYGEPPSAGLTVSSTYGQFDLCGFPKSAAFWFRSQWLLGVADDRIDKPFKTNGVHEVHIVESWESPDNWNSTMKTKSIHAYANAPLIELFINGKSQGPLPVVPMVMGDGGSYAEWNDVPWEEGTLIAVARAVNGTQVAATARTTNSNSAGLVLTLDCPSEFTGTGAALFLDGQDVALVRATVVDSLGRQVHLATNNITFSIISGPGRIQGTANGDPKSYQAHTSTSQTAYHGLVRAVVRVTSVAGLKARQKELLQSVHGTDSFGKIAPSLWDEDDIIIEAVAQGFKPVQLRIPTSTDESVASVLAVAGAGAGKKVDFFHGELPGDRKPTKTGASASGRVSSGSSTLVGSVKEIVGSEVDEVIDYY